MSYEFANECQIVMRLRPFLLFCAMTVPFGIVVHIGAEFTGMGGDAVPLTFSARHLYLLVLALGSLAFVSTHLRANSRAEVRRRTTLLIAGLPYRAEGTRFLAVSFIAQIAFFYVTQIGEGCPLCGDDFVLGCAGAFIASALGALILAVAKWRIVTLVGVIAFFFAARADAGTHFTQALKKLCTVVAAAQRYRTSLWSRPPPLVLSMS